MTPRAKVPSVESSRRPGSRARGGSFRARRVVVLAICAVLAVTALLATASTGFAAGPPGFSSVSLCLAKSHTALSLEAIINPGEHEVHWGYEYATSSGGPWAAVPGASGTITQAEVEALPSNGDPQLPVRELSGLEPEVPYQVRLTLTNLLGTASEEETCEAVPLRPHAQDLGSVNATGTTARLEGYIEPHGFATHWRFEYASSEAGPWTPVSGGEGSISQAEAKAIPLTDAQVHTEATLTGLAPAAVYYVRLVGESEPEWPEGSGEHMQKEAASNVTSVETEGPPTASAFAVHALDGEALRLLGAIDPHSTPTSEEQQIAIEGAPTGGTFALTFNGQTTRFTGTGALAAGSPTVTVALPLAKGFGNVTKGSNLITNVTSNLGEFRVGGTISGPGIPEGGRILKIKGSTLEFTAKGGGSVPATATVAGAELASTEPLPFRVGEAIGGAGIPADATITEISGEASEGSETLTLSADATVTAGGVALTAEIPFDAAAETVERALKALPGEPSVFVHGSDGGPYSVKFFGGSGEQDQPQIEGDASGLTPSGAVVVVTTQQGGEAYDTRYHFDYTTSGFTSCGTAANPGCLATPEVDLGSGDSPRVVGADLPDLKAGETYLYRVVASNNSPGDPVVVSGEQALTVPTPPQLGPAGKCSNEALRSGLSARLPDCRAYEEVTPADKEGAEDIFTSVLYNEGALVGEDGDHLMLRKEALQWGPSPDPKNSNYFFTRDPQTGWQFTSARPLGETGPSTYLPALYDSNLTQTAVGLFWRTSQLSSTQSPTIELKVGPPGGPYVSVATLPYYSVPNEEAWVAGSTDLSKLVFQTSDRAVVAAHKSSTAAGLDLYEYSADGGLHQVNVDSEGRTIGSCGATIVAGSAEPDGRVSSPHAVSADGSRVFFEAVPAPTTDCSEPANLYMRVNGSETVDIGAYRFLAADAQGEELLLEKQNAGEAFLYDTETHVAKPLAGVSPKGAKISADFSTIYFSGESLTPEAPVPSNGAADYYRYEISTATLRYLFQEKAYHGSEVRVLGGGLQISPNGRYLTFEGSEVGGVPEGEKEGEDHLFRYDNADNLVECLDCGRSYGLSDPNPPAESRGYTEYGHGLAESNDGTPREVSASSDGQFVFFTTTEALLPTDIDTGTDSSDVYEWRADGVDGCTQLQGCLALISGGRDGVRNQLLGIAEGGRDVFFATHEALVAQDQDAAGDIYDARIGGGFPAPESPGAECEGDSCSTPLSAPNDVTPASLTFTGAGNALPSPVGNPAAKSKKPKAKKKHSSSNTKRKQRGKKTAGGRRKTKRLRRGK